MYWEIKKKLMHKTNIAQEKNNGSDNVILLMLESLYSNEKKKQYACLWFK